MWPFKKKKAKEPKVDITKECIDELKAFVGIGQKFNYLGATIICTGHSEVYFCGPHLIVEPILKGDYRNNKGEIKAISFGYRELPALIAENLKQ